MADANVVAESPSDAVRFSSVILRAVECSLLFGRLRKVDLIDFEKST